jgi:3-phenylpropionate/cinnamic acid dioxygenase small subunit
MPPTPADLTTRIAVEDVVVRTFVATDEQDWATLVDCFADPIVLDMTSMVGGEPATLAPREVAAAWAEGFAPLDHVHHQIGNLRTEVHDGRATVRCYGVAFHRREAAPGVKTRMFVGTYTFDLEAAGDAWRIHRLAFHLKFIDGNLELEAEG